MRKDLKNVDSTGNTRKDTRKQSKVSNDDELCALFLIKGELPENFGNSKALQLSAALVASDEQDEKKRNNKRSVEVAELEVFMNHWKPHKKRNNTQ